MADKIQRRATFNKQDVERLYAAGRYLGSDVREKTGLSIPFDVYFQDPFVAEKYPEYGIDDDWRVAWEPGIGDGPTSARFAVVDYNADTGALAPPAEWNAQRLTFTYGANNRVLNAARANTLQFHQVVVWAIAQRALEYFEDPNGLGRRIPWGFEGNRLILVPHAGYGQNAYYDRASKSLQFYYFEGEEGQVQTCLSTDIVLHEFGHAVLDGVRPLFNESASVETAALHESIGDLTAILTLMRNNDFRKRLLRDSQGKLSAAQRLAGIGEQFGKEVEGREYLRTALTKDTMSDIPAGAGPHRRSEILTAAMFEIAIRFAKHYREKRRRTPATAFWNATQRMQRTAIQPLDFLPPVDVTFRDYALAVLRAQQLANPADPYDYRSLVLDVFVKRGILTQDEAKELAVEDYLYDRLRLSVFHSVNQIGASKANAYRFLDDNRADLELPRNRDIVVSDLYHADKYARQGRRLPRQLILCYYWREDVLLEGERFGSFDGSWIDMLCGGTLVFDQNSTVLWWAQKPASEERRAKLLDDVARLVRTGQLGTALGGERGMLGTRMPPFSHRTVDGRLRIELTPHMSLSEDHDEQGGGRRWEISS